MRTTAVIAATVVVVGAGLGAPTPAGADPGGTAPVVGQKTLSPSHDAGGARAFAPTATSRPLSAKKWRAIGKRTFRTTGFALRPTPANGRYSVRDITPRVDSRPHDADGVRMFDKNGRLFNHPVGQAQYGLSNLTTFFRNKDPFFLSRALAQAERLIATRTVRSGAWYYGYPFTFTLPPAHESRALRARWFSGMAQGEALALFSWLAETPQLTAAQRSRYRSAADATFKTLLQKPRPGRPWASHVDRKGYLWLEEYPNPANPDKSDRTYNGHLFATMGVFHYAAMSGRRQAARVFDAAATTALRYARTIRRPGGHSAYCVQHGPATTFYHSVHIIMLRYLNGATGDGRFTTWANRFEADSPNVLW